MAQQREKGGRVVFIGNIPYGVTEEQICDIFGRVGTVVNFRLVFDKETGRPKGFGFLEYTDVDAAASAVRNLNGFDVQGRTLKVDYSNDNSGGQKNQNQNNNNNNNSNQQDYPQFGAGPPDMPAVPQGTELPAGLTAPDAISQTLSKIPPPQLLDFISQMKGLITADPGKATALLSSAPQLSYATFQALLLLGLVDTSIIGSLVQNTVAQQPPQPPPQQQYAPPPPQAYQQPPQPPFGAPPAPFGQYGQPGYDPTPPVTQPAYQPPPPPQSQQAAPAPGGAAAAPPPDQAALLRQLMAMTKEQIYAQDEATRNTILQLRSQYGAPVL